MLRAAVQISWLGGCYRQHRSLNSVRAERPLDRQDQPFAGAPASEDVTWAAERVNDSYRGQCSAPHHHKLPGERIFHMRWPASSRG